MWLLEAIEFVQQRLGQAKAFPVQDRFVFDREVHNPPRPELSIPETRVLSTLQGLSDYVNKNPERHDWTDGFWIHVALPHIVSLCREPNENGVRQFHVNACCETQASADWLNRWISQEDMLISLLGVADGGDKDELVKAVQSITRKSNEVHELVEGGQKLKVDAGIGLTNWTKPDKVVELAPYRTFSEIQQPLGTFVFRVTGGENSDTRVKLVPTPDATWAVEAVKAVAKKLEELIPKGGPPIVC